MELLTRTEVENRVRLRRSSIYRLMRLGKFPEPVRVGERCVRWKLDEIEQWLADRPRATGERPAA